MTVKSEVKNGSSTVVKGVLLGFGTIAATIIYSKVMTKYAETKATASA